MNGFTIDERLACAADFLAGKLIFQSFVNHFELMPIKVISICWQ